MTAHKKCHDRHFPSPIVIDAARTPRQPAVRPADSGAARGVHHGCGCAAAAPSFHAAAGRLDRDHSDHAGMAAGIHRHQDRDDLPGERQSVCCPGCSRVICCATATPGQHIALIDGNEITSRRTAGIGALGASFLAREDARKLLVCGSGRIASLTADAFRAVRPIDKVMVWNVNEAGAARLVFDLRARGIDASVAHDLERAVGEADIVSCATLCAYADHQGCVVEARRASRSGRQLHAVYARGRRRGVPARAGLCRYFRCVERVWRIARSDPRRRHCAGRSGRFAG